LFIQNVLLVPHAGTCWEEFQAVVKIALFIEKHMAQTTQDITNKGADSSSGSWNTKV